jgi:PAS domain S-box-containing protein
MFNGKQYIYMSFWNDQVPGQITMLGKPANDYILFPKEQFQKNSLQELIDSCSIWLMDQKILEFVLKEENLVSDEFPETIVMSHEDLLPGLRNIEIPDNISFVSSDVPMGLLSLMIRQSLKKALKQASSIMEHERYMSLFVENVQPHLILDPNTGTILDANNAASELYEVPLQQIINKNISEIHPASYQILEDYLSKVPEGEKSNINIRLLNSNKKPRELQYRLNLILLEGQKCALVRVDDITDKNEAYEIFYHQSEMLRSTIESLDDLIFSLNSKGVFIDYYQPGGGTHFHISGDGFEGKSIFEVGFPEAVAFKYLKAIETVIEEDRPEQIEYYLEAFGTKLWYNARLAPRKNFFGNIDGVTVLCRDITKQKKTEETLKKARDYYMTLLADFPSMIWKTDRIKRPDYFNKTWLDFTGRTVEDEIQTDWVEKIHPVDLNLFMGTMIQAYKEKESFQIEHRLRHHSGEYRWIINAGRPFYNISGQFEGFIGSCYDITQRRDAEEMMHLQKSAMESALEGILIIQDDNNKYPVIYANRELAKLTSSKGQIVGKSFMEVLGGPLDEDIRIDLLKAFQTRQSYSGEYSCKSYGEGISQQWFYIDLAPVKDKIDNVNHFVAVISDITKSKTVEKILREKNKQLQKTNAELDSFVYSTSHELRSPLMSVLGLLNILETDIDHQDQKVYLTMIRESISRLDKIIHDIIDYSRNSRMEVENERIIFSEMIDWVIQDHKYFDNFNSVRCSVHVKESGPFISDKRRIQVILNNLISNSLRFHNFNQPDPYLEINVETSVVSAKITVKDNGSGINENHISRIYEMFYRGTEKSRGSGIGLYIVKEIVDRLDGTIKVESAVNSGTIFTVELPNFINKNYKTASFAGSDPFKKSY